MPKKLHVFYRYDPPVLIIALTWHETRAGFADFLRGLMRFDYFNNDDDVCHSTTVTLHTTDAFDSFYSWISSSMARVLDRSAGRSRTAGSMPLGRLNS